MSDLTPAMHRLLRCINGLDWIQLELLEDTVLLEEDDIVAIPGLIERGLADYDKGMEAVQITEAGRLALAGRTA